MGRYTKAWNNTLTLFGLSCCSCETADDGKERYDVSKPRFIFPVIVIMLQVLLAYCLLNHIKIRSGNFGDTLIQSYLDLTGSIIAALIVLSATLNTRNYANVKASFKSYERTVSIKTKNLAKTLVKYVVCLTVLYVISFGIDYYVYQEQPDNISLVKFLSSIVFQIYNFLSICNFAVCLFWLNKSYQLINDHVNEYSPLLGSWSLLHKKLGFQNNPNSVSDPTLFFRKSEGLYLGSEEVSLVERIRFLRAMHHELYGLSQNINELFATRNVLTVGHNFVLGTIFVYSGISELVQVNNTGTVAIIDLVVNLKWSLICFLSIFALVWASTTTCQEAKRSNNILQALLTKSVNEEIRIELQSFSYQFLHEQISFTPHGFFTLNNSLILSIVGAVVSYLVVLIQFRVSMA